MHVACASIFHVPGPLTSPRLGETLLAQAHEYSPGLWVMMTTPRGRGRLDVTDISDYYQEDPFETIEESGGLVK